MSWYWHQTVGWDRLPAPHSWRACQAESCSHWTPERMSWWVEMGLVTLISRTPEFLTHLGVGWHLGELVLLSDSGMGRVASSTFLEGLSGGELFPLDTREDVLVGGDGASDLDLSDTRVSYPSWCWLGELVLLSDSGMGRVASSTFLEGLSGGELFPLDTREDVLVGGDGASDLDISNTREDVLVGTDGASDHQISSFSISVMYNALISVIKATTFLI